MNYSNKSLFYLFTSSFFVQLHSQAAEADVAVTSLQSSRLLPVEGSKRSAQLTACRELVDAFVELQLVTRRRLHVLQGELQQHQKHVALLNEELSNACQRQHDLPVQLHQPSVSLNIVQIPCSCVGNKWWRTDVTVSHDAGRFTYRTQRVQSSFSVSHRHHHKHILHKKTCNFPQ